MQSNKEEAAIPKSPLQAKKNYRLIHREGRNFKSQFFSPSQRHRATVLPEIRNVNLKLPGDLCKAARYFAVDESKSLSA